ncbi:MAG TPA: hypothetical protein PKX92_09385 [Edaphocola sp.]|nr:hypothetical protein [Edaphocola sp.]
MMKLIVKTLIFCGIAVLSAFGTNAQNKSLLNRFYIEVGPLRGYNYLLPSYREKNFTRGYANNGLGPTGLSLGIVIGNENYQGKARFIYNGADISEVDWFGFDLMVGKIRHYNAFALEANIGLGYHSFGYSRHSPYNDYISFNQIGLNAEIGAQVKTLVGGLSPYVFTSFNLKGCNIGLGVKLLLGKPGYTRKEKKRLFAEKELSFSHGLKVSLEAKSPHNSATSVSF